MIATTQGKEAIKNCYDCHRGTMDDVFPTIVNCSIDKDRKFFCYGKANVENRIGICPMFEPKPEGEKQ